jgi:hypothetical protein
VLFRSASGTITLTFSSVGGGVFVGPGASGTTSQTMLTGTTATLYSDGTNWVTLGAGGGPVSGTTGTFSSDVTLTGATPTINFNNTAPTIATNSASSTATIFNTNVTTLNMGAAATTIAIGNNSGTTTLKGILSLAGSGSGSVKLQAASAAGSATYVLPNALPGVTGYALTCDTSGNMSWAGAGATVADDSSTATLYPVMGTITSGSLTSAKVSSSKMTFNASSGTLTVTAISAGTVTETSSIAFKENLNPITGALDKILQLASYTYDRRDGTSKNEAGLIAEDVNKVIPNLVTLDEHGKPYGIQYTKLTAYLVEAVKSLKEEINQLKGSN